MEGWIDETKREKNVNRGARLYLVTAMSGTGLIVAAVVAFVLLVSVQAAREWPVGGLDFGLGDEKAAIDSAKPLGGGNEAAKQNATSIEGLSVARGREAGTAGIPATRSSGGGGDDLAGGKHGTVKERRGNGVGRGSAAVSPVSRSGSGSPPVASTPSAGSTETGAGSGSAFDPDRSRGAAAHHTGSTSPVTSKAAGPSQQPSNSGSSPSPRSSGAGGSNGTTKGNGPGHAKRGAAPASTKGASSRPAKTSPSRSTKSASANGPPATSGPPPGHGGRSAP